MLSEEQRRKATPLSIFLCSFVILTKVCQAMDSVPNEETTNKENATQQISLVSTSGTTCSLLQELEREAGENKMLDSVLEETAIVKYISNYQIPEMETVSDSKVAEEFFKSVWESEVAESAESVASQVASTREKISYRPSFVPDFEELEKVEEIESQVQATTSTNSVEENVEEGGSIEERGTVFFYVEPAIHSEEDVFDLAKGIHGEAGNQDALEKWRVGNAMVNRFEDETGRFPQNTMHGILYAPKQFGCIRGKTWGTYTEEELQIARELLNGKRILPKDIVYFNDKWIDGYFYCKPGYHCFSGYLDHNGDSLLASAKVTAPVKQTEAEVEVVQETEVIPEVSEGVDNSKFEQESEEIVEIPETEEVPEEPEQQEEPLYEES